MVTEILNPAPPVSAATAWLRAEEHLRRAYHHDFLAAKAFVRRVRKSLLTALAQTVGMDVAAHSNWKFLGDYWQTSAPVRGQVEEVATILRVYHLVLEAFCLTSSEQADFLEELIGALKVGLRAEFDLFAWTGRESAWLNEFAASCVSPSGSGRAIPVEGMAPLPPMPPELQPLTRRSDEVFKSISVEESIAEDDIYFSIFGC